MSEVQRVVIVLRRWDERLAAIAASGRAGRDMRRCRRLLRAPRVAGTGARTARGRKQAGTRPDVPGRAARRFPGALHGSAAVWPWARRRASEPTRPPAAGLVRAVSRDPPGEKPADSHDGPRHQVREDQVDEEQHHPRHTLSIARDKRRREAPAGRRPAGVRPVAPSPVTALIAAR